MRLPGEPLLKPTLDRLYADFNHPDSATDPIQIVRRYSRADDREVVAFCAASLAFGRVASVLQSIERLMAVFTHRGDHPADYVRRFDPRRDAPAFAGLVHRWIRERDLVALVWILKQMLDRSGTIEGFFLEGYDETAADVEAALDSFSGRAMALDLRAAYGSRRGAGRGVFFPAAVEGQRVQAPQPVSALDGAPRRPRSRRLDARVAGQARRAARHPRHPCRTLPAPDALHEPGLGDGARHHGIPETVRRRRSGPVRLLALPPGHDERLRLQPRAG